MEFQGRGIQSSMGIGRADAAIAVDFYTLPKKLNPYLVRLFHDTAYTPSFRMHTLSGAVPSGWYERPVNEAALDHRIWIITEANDFSTRYLVRQPGEHAERPASLRFDLIPEARLLRSSIPSRP